MMDLLEDRKKVAVVINVQVIAIQKNRMNDVMNQLK